MASYAVNERAVARARQLINARQYVLESNWGDVQRLSSPGRERSGSRYWEPI
jgi:hypothetical protein